MQEMNAGSLQAAAKRLVTPPPCRPRICTGLQIYYLGECFSAMLPRGAGIGATRTPPQSFLQSGTIERSPGFPISAFLPPRRRTRAPPETPMRGVGGALFIRVTREWECG